MESASAGFFCLFCGCLLLVAVLACLADGLLALGRCEERYSVYIIFLSDVLDDGLDLGLGFRFVQYLLWRGFSFLSYSLG